MSVPFIRSAEFVDQGTLIRALPEKDSFADKQAKEMMGHGNPVSGGEKRPAGSTPCSSCGRYHRLGTLCFNAKSLDAVTKGDYVSISNASRGNPFHNPQNGVFAGNPHKKEDPNDPLEGTAHLSKLQGIVQKLGETKTGKPIFEPPPHHHKLGEDVTNDEHSSLPLAQEAASHVQENYEHFDPEDHRDASLEHLKIMQKEDMPVGQWLAHLAQAAAHTEMTQPSRPISVSKIHNLLKPQKKEEKPSLAENNLEDSSNHVKYQNDNYVEALRKWQSKFGGGQT